MAFDAAMADGLLSRRRMGRPETAVLVLAAVALALGAAAWISDSDTDHGARIGGLAARPGSDLLQRTFFSAADERIGRRPN